MNHHLPASRAEDLHAAISVLQARSRGVSAARLRGLEGRYRWADANGAHMFDLLVDGGLTWSADVSQVSFEVEVRVAPLTLRQLLHNRTDPLNLFTSDGAQLRCANGLAPDSARERIQKLLNLLCNGWHPDEAAKEAIERYSVRASDFTACECVSIESALQPLLARGCPAIVRDACRGWPLYGMAPQEIAARVSDAEIRLLLSEYGIDGERSAQYGTASFARYVADLYGEGVTGYMAANTVPAALDGTYAYPSAFPRESFNAPRWWVGPMGAGLKLHRDLVVKRQEVVS